MIQVLISIAHLGLIVVIINVFDERLHYFQQKSVLYLIGAGALQIVGANADPVSCFFGLRLITAPYLARYEDRISDSIKRAIDSDEQLYFLSRDMEVPRVFRKGGSKTNKKLQKI